MTYQLWRLEPLSKNARELENRLYAIDRWLSHNRLAQSAAALILTPDSQVLVRTLSGHVTAWVKNHALPTA